METITRDELIAIVTDERDEGFTYDDDLYTRVVSAIRSTPIDDLANVDLDLDDETNATPAQLVVLTLEFHFGMGAPVLTD